MSIYSFHPFDPQLHGHLVVPPPSPAMLNREIVNGVGDWCLTVLWYGPGTDRGRRGVGRPEDWTNRGGDTFWCHKATNLLWDEIDGTWFGVRQRWGGCIATRTRETIEALQLKEAKQREANVRRRDDQHCPVSDVNRLPPLQQLECDTSTSSKIHNGAIHVDSECRSGGDCTAVRRTLCRSSAIVFVVAAVSSILYLRLILKQI